MEAIEFEAAIERMGRTEDLWAATVEFARERGMLRIGYHHLPPMGAPDALVQRIENGGFDWTAVERYVRARQNGAAVVAGYAQNHPQPIYWDEIESLIELNDAGREHVDWMRAAGLLAGVSMQVFGPNARNGFFSMAFPEGRRRLPPDELSSFHWVCQAAHLRYCQLIVPTLGKPPALSSRESQVLAWVARGKSNATIGSILGISAHTVDAHLRRIYLKLGVYDRISASLRGMGFGLIHADA